MSWWFMPIRARGRLWRGVKSGQTYLPDLSIFLERLDASEFPRIEVTFYCVWISSNDGRITVIVRLLSLLSVPAENECWRFWRYVHSVSTPAVVH